MALQDELVLFPNADHDDLFDALQTMVEGAIERPGSCGFIFIDAPAPDAMPWAWRWWGRF
ncbi:MAG: hypothetical protein ACT4PE_17070 [Candidatus Eiseniibacteriota bacterium]